MTNNVKHHSIKTNAILNTARTVMGIIFPLITYPYVSRVLQVETLGMYNFSSSIISYFVLFAGLGVSNYAIREGTKYRDKPQMISTFVSEIFSINTLSMILSYIALTIVLTIVPKFHNYGTTILILSIQMFFNTIGLPWLCNIYEDFFAITVRTLTMQLVSLIAIFLFVKSPNDLNVYAAITALAGGGANIFNFFYARRNYTKFRFTFACNIKKHLKPILILFSTSLTIVIYTSSDSTMLGFFTNDYQVGLYGSAVKIYNVIKNILSAIIVVLIPRFSVLLNTDGEKWKAEKLFSESANALTVLMLPMVVGLCMLAEDIIYLIAGESYLAGTTSLQILSVATFFSLYAYMFTHCILVPLKKENLVFKITLLSALTNIGLNFFFIPLWGINGTAITTIIAEMIVFALTYRYASYEINIANIKRNFMTSLVGTMGVAILVCFLKNLISKGFVRVIISVVLSVVLYAVILIIMKNDIILGVLNNIKDIIKRK